MGTVVLSLCAHSYQCTDVHLSSSGCPEECGPQEGDHRPAIRSFPAGPHHHWDPLGTQKTKRIVRLNFKHV